MDSHFAEAMEEMEQYTTSPEDDEMSSSPTGEPTDMRPPQASSSEDATMTSMAMRSTAHNNDSPAPSPFPNHMNYRQNWNQPYRQAPLDFYQPRDLSYFDAQSPYSMNAAMLSANPYQQAAPPALSNNPYSVSLQYGQPHHQGWMPASQYQQPTPSPQPQRALDPFEPLPPLPNSPNSPFTPANLSNLPPFIKERGTTTFTLPGSLLHVAGLLYPNATFTITLATANVPMRLGGDGLAKLSQLLPAAAHNEKYHLHLVFRDWPTGQVAEFPDDAVARKYVERMEEVISPMPGTEVWYYERFSKVADDGDGVYETGERCFRVLRGFRAAGMGPATVEEVVGWMSGREGRVQVDEGGGRVIEFATGLYFASGRQGMARGGGGGGGGGGSVGAALVEDEDAFGGQEEDGDDGDEESMADESKVEESKAEEPKAAAIKRNAKGRKGSVCRPSDGQLVVTVAIPRHVAAAASVRKEAFRTGLRPRSGGPGSYASPWWKEKKEGRLVVDLDAAEDEAQVEVKEEDEDEEDQI